MLEVHEIAVVRADRPEAIAAAARERRRPASRRGPHGRVMIIAADHPARGALAAGPDKFALANRADLLERLRLALGRPGVTGVLGSPDILEDLLLLGALDDKVVIGSMNRGGLAGAAFEADDRFTGYDAGSIATAGFEGGKMLLRLDYSDAASVSTLESCASAVTALAQRGLLAMVEPFLAYRDEGRLRTELTADAMVRAVSIAAGLGTTSAYTWLKIPVVPDLDRVLAATTLPVLLLGGEVGPDADAVYAGWGKGLANQAVQGLVVGRSLLYPPGGDVAAAVDRAVSLL
jgi:hypothetical protein